MQLPDDRATWPSTVRVEIDREGRRAATGARRPGLAEQLSGDPRQLADVAPAEAAQEGAQGRGHLDPEGKIRSVRAPLGHDSIITL